MFCFSLLSRENKQIDSESSDLVFADGAMPSVTTDQQGTLYMLFVKGNGLFYSTSLDKGLNFSTAEFIDSIKDVFAVAGRGPQINCTKTGLNILALDKGGNIYSYTEEQNKDWIKRGRVNDVPDVAKEGFLSVATKDDSLYAVWLDLRKDGRNKIVGSLSADAGKTWQKNKIIYQSPSGSVCECCKPSTVFGEKGITVMFRNNLNNFRDLYIISSTDGGVNFSKEEKLGNGTWKLNACPMDGGGLKYNNSGDLQTIWRRADSIFIATLGMQEQMIGKGKNCEIENVGEQFAYTWIENGNIVCALPGNKKINIGEGTFPFLISTSKDSFICIWQHNNNIYRKLISL